MIHFDSKLHDSIRVSGDVELIVKRKFRWMRNFELIVLQNDVRLISLSTRSGFRRMNYDISSNNLHHKIAVLSSRKLKVDDSDFELVISRTFWFKKIYSEVFVNNQKVGQVLFERKFPNVGLRFVADEKLSEKHTLFIALLVVINMADLDGSE